MNRSTDPRWLRPAVAVLLVLLLGVHLATRDDVVPLGVDAHQYLLHAENLVAGRPYADTGYIQNTDRQLAPPAYPPGYPLLIAPVVAAYGTGRVPMAVVQILCLLVAVWGFWRVYHRDLAPASGLAFLVLLALNPFLWRMVNRAYSDLPFLAAVGLALVFIHRLGEVDRPGAEAGASGRRWSAYGWAVAAGLACAAAILVRILGVAVLPALAWAAVGGGWRRRIGPVAVALGAAVAVSLTVTEAVDWMDGARIVSGDRPGGGYGAFAGLLASVAELPGRVALRALDYARMDREVFWNPFSTARWVSYPLRAVVAVPLVVGVIRRVRRPRPVDVFGVVYLAALLPWSFGQPRYLIPLVPVVYALVLTGIEALWERVRSGGPVVRLGAGGVVAASVLLLVGFVGQGVADAVGRIGRGPVSPRDDGSALVLDRTPPEAVLLTSRDPRPYVYTTRRPAARAPWEMAEWEAFRRRMGATHVVVTGAERDSAAVWAERFGWRLAGRSEAADLYAPAP